MKELESENTTAKRKPSWLRLHWAVIPAAAVCLCAVLVFAYAGERAQIGIADNLDLFQAQYQMLKNTHTFFAKGAEAPFLHGISRDVLPGEWSLEALLYLIFPSFTAYILMYFVKITIGMVSFVLLAEELDRMQVLTTADDSRVNHSSLWNLALLCGLSYGILNLFPSFGIAFASIPLLVWMVLRLERETSGRRTILWTVLIGIYPFLSYFSYFGIFLIGYLMIAFIWKTVADRFHPDLRLLMAAAVLSCGSAIFEYRLFRQMLFAEEVSIRDSMVQTSLNGKEIAAWIIGVMRDGVSMHCESMQKYLVLPVCAGYFLLLNISYLRKRNAHGIFHDIYNLAALILIFNSVIYGLYYSESFRSAIETIVPQLKGFQFNRTAFFNPFLWYGMFFLALYRLALWIQAKRTILPRTARFLPYILAGAAVLVIMFHGNAYNDLLNTAKADAKRILGREESDALNYGEFYSVSLFDKAKQDLEYDGEWAVAYGLHPAVLEYNGISTLDGYLGFYSQEYKEQFRKVIAPALEENEATREYFDDWGARCYIYSGHNATVVEAVRNYPHSADTIDIDPEALRDLGCTYIFSRIRITNAEEKQLQFVGTYTDEGSLYIIYVYRLEY